MNYQIRVIVTHQHLQIIKHSAHSVNLQIQKLMKPKQPIMMSSIFEYYLEGDALRRPKSQLIEQLQDMITISQFLISRIPTIMKNMKETIRVQQASIRDLTHNVRNCLKAEFADPRNNQCFYLESAYNMFSHFMLNKFVDDGGTDKTVAEKEMKLKFLQAENLPQDFLWEKPQRNRDRNKPAQKAPKDPYLYCTHFNPRLNMLQIQTRKYRIFISMMVDASGYVWIIDRIQVKISQEIVYWMKEYFDDKVRKEMKARYGAHYENNMLAGIDAYAYFLELMDLNLGLFELTESKFFSQRITLKVKGKEYQFEFAKPEDMGRAIVTITRNDCPNLSIMLKFHKKQTQCFFKIGDLVILQTNEHFKYDNPKSLICLVEELLEYGSRVEQFFKNFNFESKKKDMERKIFIKLAGMYMVVGENDWITTGNYYMINQDGVYLGALFDEQIVYCSILGNGQLASPKISRSFLNRLIKLAPDLNIFFTFILIVIKVLRDNGQRECELDHYFIGEKQKERDKIQLHFRKKVCAQDQMIRANIKSLTNEEQTFNSIKLMAEINIQFNELAFYHFRDPQQKIPYERQSWKTLFNPRFKPASQLLDPAKVIEAIKYVQDNVIFKYVIERKMKNESKPLYSIKI